MSFVQYLFEPELRSPVLVAAFGGWNDAADSATTAIKFLIDRWKPTKFAEIEAEEFYVFTETRPIVQFVDGKQRSIKWPENQFLYYRAPELGYDVILFLGVEPQLKWKTFTQNFLEVCNRFNVSEVVLLGALLADVPHSIAVPITGTSSNNDMMERLKEMDINNSRYEGPTGIVGVLQGAFQRQDLPAASLWAAAPHYLAATPNIKVTSALLTHLNTFLSFGLDLNDIQSDALRFEEQISTLVARDPEASAYVRKLEEQVAGLEDNDDEDDDEETDDADELVINPDRVIGTGPLPSADTLIRGVEELLRKQRENGKQQSNEEKDEE